MGGGSDIAGNRKGAGGVGGWVSEPTRGVRGAGIGRRPPVARDGGQEREEFDGDEVGRREWGVDSCTLNDFRRGVYVMNEKRGGEGVEL